MATTVARCEEDMSNEMMGLLGRKVGMTQMYDENDILNGVTVIDVSGNTVIAIRSEDGADGYNAIQLGIDEQKEQRKRNALGTEESEERKRGTKEERKRNGKV